MNLASPTHDVLRELGRRAMRGASAVRFVPAYLGLAVAKHLIPIRRLGRAQWRRASGPRDPRREARVVADIVRVSRRLGFADRDCLQRSLLVYRELSRAGADPTLVVGVRRTDDGLAGHAWVLIDGAAIAESPEHASSFQAMFQFGRDGVLVRIPER